MKIVLVSSEVVPFSKTGGLADVAGALPKALVKEGHEVYVFTPRYKSIDKKKFGLKSEIKRVRLKMPTGTKEYNILSAKLPDSEVPIYFIDKELYFGRTELYQEKGKDYPDNAERFHYFCLAALESLKVLDIQPDVIHCNDWQTAIIPLYLKLVFNKDPFFNKISTIYTIHNLAYHGLFDPKILASLGMNKKWFTPEKLEFWNKVNFSKGGLLFADIISTVSNKYSKEIQTKEFGCGLEGVLSSRAKDTYGIINGLDYAVWSPEKDRKIPKRYSIDSLHHKDENRKKLMEISGLEYKENTPIISIISRLADQKGFDLLAESMDELLKKDIKFVILGTGDQKYHELFDKLEKKYPDKFKAHLKFDAKLAQLIYAGSDIFLMPSLYEPCGLGQLISLKYGTVPVVRATGGLADTITDINKDSAKGNGFTFKEYKSKELLAAINRSLDIFSNNKEKWQKIQINGMSADYSWSVSAKKYTELYETAKSKS
ncbi:glycogen synthase GlgA [Candidatus Margulisiibacteriota bacterium]